MISRGVKESGFRCTLSHGQPSFMCDRDETELRDEFKVDVFIPEEHFATDVFKLGDRVGWKDKESGSGEKERAAFCFGLKT